MLGADNTPKYQYVAPNIAKYPDSHQFWTNALVNHIMSEGWYQNDLNYHNNLRMALEAQKIIIDLLDLKKRKKDDIKKMT